MKWSKFLNGFVFLIILAVFISFPFSNLATGGSTQSDPEEIWHGDTVSETLETDLVGPDGGTPETGQNPLNPVPDAVPLGVGYGSIYKGDVFKFYLNELNLERSKIYVFWEDVEPQNNQYNFNYVDAYISQLDPGDEAMISVFTSSSWGAEGVGKGYPPLDYNEYYTFIYDLVSRTNGMVKYWQRDAEPFTPMHWAKEKCIEYVTTQMYFYQAVKAANPDAEIIGIGHSGCFSGDRPGGAPYIEYVMLHAQDYFDMVDVRLYRNHYNIPVRIGWFRDKMVEFGYSKPIVTTEYGGPHPYQFDGFNEMIAIIEAVTGGVRTSENLVMAWAYLVDNLHLLTPQMQMFFLGCSPELEAKLERIQTRDFVQRTLLVLASEVELLWYFNLKGRWHPQLGPHPFFGKLSLVSHNSTDRRLPFYTMQKMVQKIGGYVSNEFIDVGDPNLFLFRISREGQGDIYVAWEMRNIFEGETMPASPFTWTFPWDSVRITDFFERDEVVHIQPQGDAIFDITDTPVFIEEYIAEP